MVNHPPHYKSHPSGVEVRSLTASLALCFIIKRWRSKNGEGEERDRLKRKGALKGEALSYHGTISSVIRTGSLTASLALCFLIKRWRSKNGEEEERD